MRGRKVIVLFGLIAVMAIGLVIGFTAMMKITDQSQELMGAEVESSESTIVSEQSSTMDNATVTASVDSTYADDTSLINEQTESMTEESSSTEKTAPDSAGTKESSESTDPGKVIQETEKKSSVSSQATPVPVNDGSEPSQAKSNVSTVSETVMTDSEYQKVKDTVNDYADTAAKATTIKIKPLALSLSGLESNYNAVMSEQTELQKKIDEFNSISSRIKASEIKDGNRDSILSASSDISGFCSSLQEELSELKSALNQKDLDSVGGLLDSISKNCSDTNVLVEKINNALNSINN